MTVADARIGKVSAEHVHLSRTDANVVPEGENGAVANATIFGEDPPLDRITRNGFYTTPDHLSHISPVDNALNYSKVLTLPYTFLRFRTSVSHSIDAPAKLETFATAAAVVAPSASLRSIRRAQTIDDSHLLEIFNNNELQYKALLRLIL